MGKAGKLVGRERAMRGIGRLGKSRRGVSEGKCSRTLGNLLSRAAEKGAKGKKGSGGRRDIFGKGGRGRDLW